MKYCIGYDERINTNVFKTEGNDVDVFNLAIIMDQNDVNNVKTLIEVLDSFILPTDIVIVSYEILNQGIRDALLRGKQFTYDDYQLIIKLATQYILHFRSHQNKEEYYPPRIDIKHSNRNKWPKGLFGRYGNVELRVIDNWISSYKDLHEIERKVCASLDSEKYMYSEAKREHWLSSSDIEFNIRKLMTNAGFYSAQEDDGSLEAWCTAYYNALKNSTTLFPYPNCYPNFFIIQDKLFSEQKFVRYDSFPAANKFYEMLAEENILFVTPFASLINESYTSGRIFNLYKDINIPQFEILALPAYVSTYPNRPHNSWLETFEYLKEQIDNAFKQKTFTLFFASAGCYGMPLADYVYSTYGCPCVYFGNQINTMFGIRQACSDNFMKSQRITENWLDSDLGSILNVDRIDGGRYV